MKLRLRSLETEQTLKIELPNSSTLQQLKQVLSQSLSSSSSLHLFLNRIYDLHASSPEASLQSLGIISGDLIFFTLTPDKKTLEHEISDSETDINMSDSTKTTKNLLQEDEEISGSGPSGAESMEFDNGSSVLSRKKYFEHYFLRRVLREELGNGDRSGHKLMVIAVHAVLLESGFVGFDSVSGMPVDRLHLPDVWPSKPFTLCYTLPYNVAESESIDLKFQHVGHCINIYGSLPKGAGSGLHRVCLNENRFVPALESLWAADSEINNQEGYLEIEVFEFWKTVKDEIALPLLIDLCEMAGLVLPPCLMRLPPELKLKIFESLPVVDIVKVGCVCSELQNLSTSNELWKQKFVEEFGNGTGAKGWIHWKINFKSFWERKKKREREREGRISRVFPQVPVPIPLWRPSPIPLWRSIIIWTTPVTQSFYNHGPVLEVNPLVEIRKL